MDQVESLNRRTGIALWRQIANTIRKEIQAGTYAPGSQLPTEMALAKRFHVNRHTLRRAVASLQEEGLLRIEQGRGTFVQEDVVDYRIGKRTRFSETIAGLGRIPGVTLLRTQHLRPDPTIADNLRMSQADLVLCLTILRKVDERPIYLTSHFLPADRFVGIDEALTEEGSLTRAFSRYGVSDYTRARTHLSARLPSQEEAALLDQPRTQPILVTENLSLDGSGMPIEFSVARAASSRIQVVIEP
ncbi:MAG: phosphonate metabolism transcriptional regulator PhnF [Pseudomonadota bacterium]